IESSPTAVDSDNDGRIDSPVDVLDENGAAGMDGVDDTRAVDVPLDTDNDGIPDFRDLDSDGDTITDLAESVPAGTDPATLDSDGDGVQDAIDPISGRPLGNGQLIPQDIDMDGELDFRAAAGFTLDNLPGGEGFGLRSSVSGGGGSAGLMLLMLGLPLIYRLFVVRNFGRIRANIALGCCVALLSGSAMFVAPQVQAADSKQTLCGYFFDGNKHRISSGDEQEREQGSFGKCWYGGVGLAYSHLHPEGRDGNGWATDDGDDRDSGWSVLIGKRLNEHWFAELKYADQGAGGLDSSLPWAGGGTLGQQYPDAGISYKTASLMMGRYLRDSDNQFNWYAKAGIASINNEAEKDAGTVLFNEVTTEQLAFGLGAEYRFGTSRWFARLNADFYDQDAILAGLSINRYLGGTREGAITPVVAAPAPTVVKPEAVLVQPPVVAGQDRARELLQQRREQQRRTDCSNFDGVVEGINFETDSARLTSESRFKLLTYARSLSMYPGTVVRVSAHTDWVGNGAYNQNLSERRAASVVEFLVQGGVQRSQLQSRGYGETMPIADNNTRSGRARNRRVELSIIESPECAR
ncbi:MAG: OmpA family protein, partial [Gammaproteobacteria bacterium]|nr:OmpA family protein [Gammaproteobacteria bacterium]